MELKQQKYWYVTKTIPINYRPFYVMFESLIMYSWSYGITVISTLSRWGKPLKSAKSTRTQLCTRLPPPLLRYLYIHLTSRR